MASALSNVSGLASGVQWNDLIDQLMTAEQARTLDPVTARVTTEKSRVTAWTSFRDLVTKLNDASKALANGSAFGAVSATASASTATGRSLLAVSAASGAAAGNYKVEVLDLARAEKVSGSVVASASTALGISGTIVINGRKVALGASDTLLAVRDRINAVNTGTSASRVTATILGTAGGAQRLVLTSDVAGTGGIDLLDGGTGALTALGITDGTTAVNATATGGAQTQRFGSVTSSIAAMLGVTMPAPSTVKIGGRTISVDLSVDSLSAIAARIQAAGGSAETVTESAGSATTYRLVTNDRPAVDPADAVNSQRTLEILGLVTAGRSAVAQSITSGTALGDGATSLPATAATKLSDLATSGGAGGVQVGDSFTMRGTRADGSAVSLTYTVQSANDTIADVLAKLDDATSGFGAGSRPATATITSDGRIRLTDVNGGDSQLALSIVANNEGGGSLDFGRTSITTVGRQREAIAGSDARVKIDGVVVTRGSNTIGDALDGVTLTLQQAEAGSTIDVTVARDLDATTKSVQTFVDAYNAVLGFAGNQRNSSAPLAFNGTLRAAMGSLTGVLLGDLPGTVAPYNRAGLAGVSLTRTGTLAVDATRLRDVILSHPQDAKTLFAQLGGAMGTAAERVTKTDGGTVQGQLDSLSRSIDSLGLRATDLQTRLTAKRAALTSQFTAMESALARIQAQGSSLTSQISQLQASY